MNNFFTNVTTIATAIIGLALVAAIISSRSRGVEVIREAGRAFTGSIGVALSPITGGSFTDYGARGAMF